MNHNNGIQVVVAEDDYLVSEMVQGLLQEMGYQVMGVASNGRQIIKMAKQLKPDVIIMDIQMADIDGITAAKEIQRSYPIPVVVLTAYETPDLVRQASEAGVGAYLIKPPNSRELERAITIALARHLDMLELRRLNNALTEYNEELDAFAHTVAHDLQNPLGQIIGFADLILDNLTDYSSEEIGSYVQLIAQSGQKMSQIIDELLLLSGVRRMTVEPRPFDTADAVREARERLTLLIRERKAEILMPDQWPRALGYRPWVEEVWVNYLSNAIKYGGDPPRIELGADQLPDNHIRFWVRDNGPGLSPDDQQRLFTPFTQLNQVLVPGHGLGLSIVQRIIKKLDGRTGVDSDLGQGSVFWFSLPGA